MRAWQSVVGTATEQDLFPPSCIRSERGPVTCIDGHETSDQQVSQFGVHWSRMFLHRVPRRNGASAEPALPSPKVKTAI